MIGRKTITVRNYWEAVCRKHRIQTQYYWASTFADPKFADYHDQLLHLLDSGEKRATAHLQQDFNQNGIQPRKEGDYWIILDTSNSPRALVQITQVDVWPFNEVPEAIAELEGEGDRSLEYWRKVHRDYFSRQCAYWGLEWHEDLPTVCEQFEILEGATP